MDHKKKILYIEGNRDGSIGGSYYSMLYLIQGLDKLKYEPHVLFCQENVLLPEFEKVASVHINNFDPFVSSPLKTTEDFIKWPYRFFFGVILKQFKIKKIINEIGPDLVHLNNGQAAMHEWVLACNLNKIKIVIHDRGARPPYSLQTRLFVRFIDALISISDYYNNYVIEANLKIKRLERIYNGLDFNKFDKQISESSIRKMLKDYNIQNARQVVGIIGNIDRWKGQLVVLRAIKELKAVYPDIICLIVGTVLKGAENYKQELDEYISNNGLDKNVIFTGFIKDIPNIISIFDILVHASIEPEPFGRVILEGMAANKPIVATNKGGVPEIVINNETAILVPMNDPGKMADAIKYYLSNKAIAETMAAKGRQRLIKLFSTEKMVQDVEKVYEDIFYGE